MSGPVKGRADYLALGDYNAACSMCGRKRKASYLVRNWQGLYRCPEHNEPRQPQDFVRNIKDIMTVPWAQPEQDTFVKFTGTFPLTVSPTSLVLSAIATDLLTEAGSPIQTEAGGDLEAEQTSSYSGSATVGVPVWITLSSTLWSWYGGGAGITINSKTSLTTLFASATSGAHGVAQCVVTNNLDPAESAIIYLPVSVP